MNYYKCGMLDNQIKVMQVMSLASGSIASFSTDLTENLVSCIATIDANASGVSSVTITSNGDTYTVSLGESITTGGSLNVTTGVLTRSDSTTKQLDALAIATVSGSNSISADCGNIQVKYLETVGHTTIT